MASYTRITAPFAGVVSERHADPGDMAAPGAPLVTVEAGGSRQLEVRVDEARASAIALHQVVRVRLDAMEDDDGSAAAVTGHVVEIARVDPASHSFVVKIDLPDGATLRSGTFGRAIFDGPIRRALVVPATAVVRRGQLVFVFTVTDNVARLRPISVGRTVDAGVEVAAGILPGEAVVTSPPDFLVDGTTVSAAGAGETR
jgi:RND family efflux transporter MFP subunit